MPIFELSPFEVSAFSEQMRSIELRRESETMIEALSADAVGDFPDQNVAEALQRVAGLSVQRDQGEGRFVVIRGIDPNLNTSTVNGMRIPGPEAGSRAVNLDTISSDLVGSVEINKTLTPDMDGDAVGGNIEIKTRSAFDFGQRQFSITAGGSYNTTNEKTSPDYAFTYSDVYKLNDEGGEWGLAFAFSQFDRDTVSDGIEGAPWEPLEGPDGTEVIGLLEGEQRDYVLTRKRTSASLNLDFRPNERTRFYIRTMYSEFDDAETKEENIYKFEDGDVVSLDAEEGLFEGAEFEKVHSDSNKIMEVISLRVGGEHELDLWRLNYSLGYADAGEEGDLEIVGEYLAEGVDMGYRTRGDFRQPELFVRGEQGTEAEDFELQAAEGEGVDYGTEELAFEFNALREVAFGERPGYVKFGFKARLTDVENNVDKDVYDEFDATYTLAGVAQSEPVDFPPRGAFGPAVDRDAYREFFFGNRPSFGLNEADSLIDSRIEDYETEEDVYAGYLMGKADFDRFSVVGGVRYEYTDYSTVGTTVTIDEQVNDGDPFLDEFADDKTYGNLLPSVHVTIPLSDRMFVRAAASRSLARPGIEAAAPFQIIEIEGEGDDIERVAERGNPDLEPLESTNLDVRWDYYPSELSLISAGLFYKDISDFFLTANVAGEPPYEDFDEVIQVINGGDGHLFGFEFKYTQQLSAVSERLDGFLIDANYTFSDSESDNPDRVGGFPLPGQSDHIFSVALGYQKHGFNIRLAATYRSEFFEETDDASDPAFDRYQDGHLQVDFTAKYYLNNIAQIYFNIINLNDEPLYAYWGDPRFNSQYEEYGPTVEAGVKLQF
ncbi:MAG: TonB-dependent receptor [Opitutales bacterium]